MVNDLGRVTSVACGSEHVLVLTSEGKVYAFGWNEHGMRHKLARSNDFFFFYQGQLGVGDTKDRVEPTQVLPQSSRKCSAIASGYGHSFGVWE